MTSLLELSPLKDSYKIKIIFITAFTKNYASSPVFRLLGSCQKYPHFDFALLPTPTGGLSYSSRWPQVGNSEFLFWID